MDMNQIALLHATEVCDIETMQNLLDRGVPIDSRDCNQNTPLHLVLDKKCVEFLINNGCDLDARNSKDQTASMVALECYRADAAILLVDFGADVASSEEQLEETIPRPIRQAATKQLIGAMVPNEVLCVVVDPENFKNLSLDFNKFLAILREGDEKNLIFCLDKVTQDVFTLLQGYYQHHPSSIQAISVRDPVDFLELAKKSGPGAGTPKRNCRANEIYLTIDILFRILGISPNGNLIADYPWSSLRADRIKKAFQGIPEQVGVVECAANSAARALILIELPQTNFNYRRFAENCPQDVETIAKNQTPYTHIIGGVATLALAPFTLGGSLACFGAVCAGSALGVLAEKNALGAIGIKSGPSLWELSKYINQNINQHMSPRSTFKESIVNTYVDFKDCAKSIASDIRDVRPVIVLIFWGPTRWHYATVIATKGSVDRPEGFMLLDTDSSFEYRKYDNMQHVMYNQYKFISSFSVGGTPKGYNIIRFIRR